MEPLNEQTIKRLQKLAGIQEIAIINPNAKKLDLKIPDGDYLDIFTDLIQGQSPAGELELFVSFAIDDKNQKQNKYNNAYITNFNDSNEGAPDIDILFYFSTDGIRGSDAPLDEIIEILKTHNIKWMFTNDTIDPVMIIIPVDMRTLDRLFTINGKNPQEYILQ